MRNKRGISALIATVLLILMTVAAAALIFGILIPYMRTEMESGKTCNDVRLEIVSGEYTFYNQESQEVYVQVKRGGDDVNIEGLQIIISGGGNSKAINVGSGQLGLTEFGSTTISLPGKEESRTYVINAASLGIGSFDLVSVAPIVKVEGREKICGVNSKATISGGEGDWLPCIPNCEGKVCGDDGCLGQCPPGCPSGRTCVSGNCVCIEGSCTICTSADVCSLTGTQTCTKADCTTETKSCTRVTQGTSCGTGKVCYSGACCTKAACQAGKCGIISDNCGGTIDCGCDSGYACSNGQCVASCTNDVGCTSTGAKQCSGNAYQTCGNYDADACLEWSSATSCSSGYYCFGGTCSEWALIYDANALPQNSAPVWTKVSNVPVCTEGISPVGNEEPGNQALILVCPDGSGPIQYTLPLSLAAGGFEIDMRIKNIKQTGTCSNALTYTIFSPMGSLFYIYCDHISVSSGSWVDYYMDTTNAFHVYRFVKIGSNIKVYVDSSPTPAISLTSAYPEDSLSIIRFEGKYLGLTFTDYIKAKKL